ncbi:hypothetical protein MVEG_00217 [Podila verticillata NRRL 6337]|nr:hypothetical protein MVEG_00217 [Podila verticillata NRRL 6337]
MPSKRTSIRSKPQQLSAAENILSTEPLTPTPSIDTFTTTCTSHTYTGIDVTRLPRHFQQPEEDWGDLDQYIQSRPIANSRTHFSQLKSYLDQIIADGNDSQRRVATDMKNSTTFRKVQEAIETARAERMRKSVPDTVKTKFIDQTYTEVGETLALVRRDILGATNDVATKKQKIGRHQCIDEDELEVDENVVDLHLLNDHEEQEQYEQDGDKDDRYLDEQIEDNENIEEDDHGSDADVEEPASIPCTPKQLEEFEPLGQSLGWHVAGINLLQQLVVAQHDRAYTEYSLTRDAIADVSPKGDFVPFLEGAYKGVMEAIPKLAESERLAEVLDRIAPTNELRFRQVLANSKVLERGPLQDYVCKVLGHLENVFPVDNSPLDMNERHFFETFVVPTFQNAFTMRELYMQLFEVQIIGCSKRLNRGREPMLDKVTTAHFADAVVAWHGMQPVLMEAASPIDRDQDKPHWDHHKLGRDLKDTWRTCMERLAQNRKQPPKDLKVFGVQAYEDRVDAYCLDFVGCFRLQLVASFVVPANRSDFSHTFRNAVQMSFDFVQLVADEIQRWRFATALKTPSYQITKALESLPSTTHAPAKTAKSKRRRDDVDE